jgi:starch-binding outer membrane protein SusE/F
MKKLLNKLFLLLAASVLVWSCKKEATIIPTKNILDPSANSVSLSVNSSTLILLQPNADNLGVVFSWTKALFGYPAAITYTIQVSRADANFSSNADSTTILAAGTNLSKTLTVIELNRALLNIVKPGVAFGIQIRVKASVGDAAPPVYSNVVNLTITPYRDVKTYAYPNALWVAGNYQGWSPGTAPQIVDASATPGTNYEGYINFVDGPTHEFKMVKGNDWSAGDYGSGSAAGSIASPGGNISFTGPAGVYLLRANTVAKTFTATKINTWGIIGSATPGGWDNSTAMAFNAGDGTWTITTNLSAGEMKFRANNDWAINFGDSNADTVPNYDGSNIVVAQAGNYTITLDIGLAGNYTYTLKKH